MSAPQIPPSGPTASPSPSGAAGLVALPSEIVRLPQELAARLLNGLRTVFVSGTVTGQGPDGALHIRSQFGEIAVRAGTAVPADRQVSLQIPPLSGKAATLTPPLLSRNPIPASLLFSKPAAPQAATVDPSALNTGSPAGRAAPPPGSPAPAVPPVLSAPPAPSTPVTGSAVLQQGGPAGQPASTGPGSGVPANTPASQSGGPPPSTLPNRPAPLPQAAAPTQSPPTATPAAVSGDRSAPAGPALGRLALTAQLLTQSGGQPAAGSPTPTAAQPSALPPSATPQQPGATPQGPGAPAPGAASPPPVGSAATMGAGMSPAGARTPPPLPSIVAEIGREAVPMESARRVPAMREAISVLSAADPILATQFVRSVLPQANSQLAATLLFFLSATRSGDIGGWMGGRVASSLNDAGRGDLLPKLSAELAAPGRTTPDSAAGEWRSQTIPLYQDGEIGGMAVHVRRSEDEGGEAGDREAAGHRFLIDMDLSRMGPMQLDGLVHDTRFDLTIRSPAAFPEPMRQDMRTLFRDASNAVGLHGGLTFQAGGHDWATVATASGG